ncbi:MAG: DUF1015 family protein [Lachnospiraceae bacterium]|nr:DUF1015 family protein [Lachnospiraceae bacterium]
MATVKPFKAIRPKKGLESKIAALPYDVYSSEEAKIKVKDDDYSFLRIDRAETQFDDVYIYSDEVYEKAARMFRDMLKKGDFVRDENENYYIYELTMDGRTQTGIVAVCSIDDYLNNVIRKHENTRADKEEDRIRHVDALSAQSGPIFLAYKSNDTINSIVDRVKEGTPDYDFVSDDGIRHRGFFISDAGDIKAVRKAFDDMNEIYIADGHHRCASAVKVGLKRREAYKDHNGSEEFNYFLSVLFPDDQLMIMDYNRVIKDLNGHSPEEILAFLRDKGQVTALEKALKPEKKGDITVCLDGKWYLFTPDPSLIPDDPVDSLDVAVLQNEVLKPLFDINDPKTDKRIDFVGGIRGLSELERRVGSDCRIAFCMYPTGIHELFRVADANRLMPPKSTWFEPKLRSGLYIHEIEGGCNE